MPYDFDNECERNIPVAELIYLAGHRIRWTRYDGSKVTIYFKTKDGEEFGSLTFDPGMVPEIRAGNELLITVERLAV